MRILSTFLLSFYGLIGLSQSVPIGQWQDHLSYTSISHVALANDKVYASSGNGLFSVLPEEGSVQRLGTINGLSDISVVSMGASSPSDALFVGYENGVIDIVNSNNIFSYGDIKRSTIIGNKQVNHFNFYNDKTCFISTGFGVLEFDLTKNEVKETYLIGKNGAYVFVNATEVFDGKLWAATTEGIYFAELKNALFDPKNWSKDTTILNKNAEYNIVINYNNTLLVNQPNALYRKDTVFELSSNEWKQIFTERPETFHSITKRGERLIVANSTSVEVYNNTFDEPVQRLFQYDGKQITPRTAAYSLTNEIWLGDIYLGLIKSIGPYENDQFLIEGPASTKAFRINYSYDNIFVSGGGHSDIQVRTNTRAEVSKFNGANWTLYTKETLSAFDTIEDIINTSLNPKNQNQLALASMNNGIVIIEDDKVKNILNFKNSGLEELASSGATFVTGVQYDAEGNLWASNSVTISPIKVLTADGEWIAFEDKDGSISPRTNQLLVTGANQVWQLRPGIGVYVLDHNGTLNNPDDDQHLLLQEGAGNGALASNDVTAIAEDVDGGIWVGTNIGLTVFYNASNLFENQDIDGDEILISQDGQTQVLFENQFITDIVIDPANRKWVSTRGAGVYLMSSDGTTELKHFTEENSPLYSNNVNNIGILLSTGEVFMGTEKGIISYRGEATLGIENLDNILVFPNPVPPNFDGVVGISGLTDKSEVLISDVGGSVIQRLTSSGGQAVWDLQNFNGNKVIQGVYLIYVRSGDGKLKNTAKVLVEH